MIVANSGQPVIDDLLSSVLARDACSGCGLCAAVDSGIHMEIDAKGYSRPVRRGPRQRLSPRQVRAFRQACPGFRVQSPQEAGTRFHPIFGPYLQIWRAHATDPDTRHLGSSGGVLTALSAWLLATGRASRILTAGAHPSDPRRTVPVIITTKEEALSSAGSRYAPVPTLAGLRDGPTDAVAAKPCEVAALRAYETALDQGGEAPLLLSFFCAGTPSQHATSSLMETLGADSQMAPDQLWYRGRGWPGAFTVRRGGRTWESDYHTSWGKHLGPATQWRCKICPDGTGGSADIVAADLWHSDADGYPIFSDTPGVSALIARTRRGAEAIRLAHLAGVIDLEPASMEELTGVQPLQVSRRGSLVGRLVGSHLARRQPPRYYGFRLSRLAAKRPRDTLRTIRATYRRVRAQRADMASTRR